MMDMEIERLVNCISAKTNCLCRMSSSALLISCWRLLDLSNCSSITLTPPASPFPAGEGPCCKCSAQFPALTCLHSFSELCGFVSGRSRKQPFSWQCCSTRPPLPYWNVALETAERNLLILLHLVQEHHRFFWCEGRASLLSCFLGHSFLCVQRPMGFYVGCAQLMKLDATAILF